MGVGCVRTVPVRDVAASGVSEDVDLPVPASSTANRAANRLFAVAFSVRSERHVPGANVRRQFLGRVLVTVANIA